MAKEISLVIAGEAGQGVQSIETVLVKALKKAGYNFFATKEYMSRVRGGVNSVQIRISEKRVRAYSERIDLLVPLNKEALPHLEKLITPATAIIGEKEKAGHPSLINIPFSKIGSEFGNALYANSVAVGVLCGILDSGKETLFGEIREAFGKKEKEVQDKNVLAAGSGYEIGRELVTGGTLKLEIPKPAGTQAEIVVSGAEAAALGAIAGGCDAVFAYPMTPGTSMFTALAGYAKAAGIAVEQVEDEIGVINMALGASYAGASPLVATSGGGFALMTEGVSLAGMTETPVVIYLSQRPGPATGLPTRTEQGDLNLSLYAGHGVFPRIILAPKDTEGAYGLAAKAFSLAAKFQSPVFILVDQFFVDSYYNTPAFDPSRAEKELHITETKEDYMRYSLAAGPISPRGVPGFGSGNVCADSDEHDESGRITEDLDGVHMKMAEKRLTKGGLIEKEIPEPLLEGDKEYDTLVIGWGSTYNAIKEALEISKPKKTAHLHFEWIYPVTKKAAEYIKKAKKVLVVENNQTGQFADLLEKETMIKLNNRILKWNGLTFYAEELARRLREA